MTMKPLGKSILFLLALGIAVGGWRIWSARTGKGGAGSVGFSLPKFGGNPKSEKGAAPASIAADGSTELTLLTTATKAGWLQTEVDRFNETNAGKYHVKLAFTESREAMHDILDGKTKPTLWSPSSPVWIARLGQVWRARAGQRLVDVDDPNSFRTYLKSPLVILTTTEKATFLKQIFSSAKPWAAVRDLSAGRRRAPWGMLRWTHADPINANSGMLTMGSVLNEYAQSAGRTGNLEKVAVSPGFLGFLGELERGMLFDEPAEKGSSALTKAFASNPGSRDFITTYESSALEAVADNARLTVVYPNPTVVSEQSVALLSGSWVTGEQRAGGEALMTFLGSREAIEDGVKSHFRPASSSSASSLTGELSRYASQGFQQTYTAVELPPYEALNSAAFGWREQKVGRR